MNILRFPQDCCPKSEVAGPVSWCKHAQLEDREARQGRTSEHWTAHRSSQKSTGTKPKTSSAESKRCCRPVGTRVARSARQNFGHGEDNRTEPQLSSTPAQKEFKKHIPRAWCCLQENSASSQEKQEGCGWLSRGRRGLTPPSPPSSLPQPAPSTLGSPLFSSPLAAQPFPASS